ncbi:hypothetical protein [Sphingomonas paucimobilis]|uniref:hypothetical protein n=1 Tax=Sphingomonas paucimobilis TaxID=13689 RepID=UPI0020425824|nr:hypothetical protein [Sphingomonas paucimobilis]MCM3680229.1 hypothetical protein [Sphingomonas paucimobilis]
MISALLLALASPPSTSGRGTTVMEEKVTHVFKLNAQRRRWGAIFDAVAGATLVVANDGELTLGEQSDIVVALVKTNPVLIIGDLTTLVMDIADAIGAGERDAVVQMIERGKPRDPSTAWATAGKMVEIVRLVRGLDEETVERVLVVIKMIGEHPLMLGFPS